VDHLTLRWGAVDSRGFDRGAVFHATVRARLRDLSTVECDTSGALLYDEESDCDPRERVVSEERLV